MNKILICIAVLFLSGNLQAQDSTRTTTLFEYGEPLKSSEANFRNLFQNFPKFVTNANKGIELLSYKYVTRIRNQQQIKRYLKKNTKVYMVDGGTSIVWGVGTDSTQIEKSFIRIDFQPEHQVNNTFLKDLKEKLKTLANKIHQGDEVYVLNFTVDYNLYEFYMFVNPTTRVLLTEGNFLGFKIPLDYADFHSKKN